MSVASDRKAFEDRERWRRSKDGRRKENKAKQQPFPDPYGGGPEEKTNE